jgi:hypothetical protein
MLDKPETNELDRLDRSRRGATRRRPTRRRPTRRLTRASGLISYDIVDSFRGAAGYVDRILKGGGGRRAV